MDPLLQDSEIDKYRAIPQASMMDNPLQFWKERSFDFPNLIVLAEEYLCVQASSVAAERVFSTSGDIVSSTRACLKTDQVDALVFLKIIWAKNDNLPCNVITDYIYVNVNK